MGKIDYESIYAYNRRKWEGLTDEPEKYEALLAGHYSDSNHFVYELLQNAEDAQATKVAFECYDNKLVFYHNGNPFDEDDVRGVSSMLMGTKTNRDSAQTIGHFGMGFKSVFKYTNIPEIYSDDEAFRIERYLLPVEIEEGWNLNEERKNVKCKISEEKSRFPFLNDEHLTKFVIPFVKKNSAGEEIELSSHDVIEKLKEFDGRILLFLSHIKELYWSNKDGKEYAYISLDVGEKDKHIITCRIEGSEYDGKEDITKFLKFDKQFEHKEYKYSNVSIAYKLNARANNINPLENQYIWVYFPTKDETKLPFLVHGSFETAVSREKLMEPSAYNDDLYGALTELICDSLEELKDRGLITQNFIRQVILPAFGESRLNNLKKKITDAFTCGKLLPDGNGNYYGKDEAFIAVPFGISDFYNTELFKDSFGDVKGFVNLNDANGARFREYFNWLAYDLFVPRFTLESWAINLMHCVYEAEIKKGSSIYKELEAFYDFLSDNRASLLQASSGMIYSYMIYNGERVPVYENINRMSVESGWNKLKEAPIILNNQGILVPAIKEDKPNIYLASSSKYKKVSPDAVVNNDIVSKFEIMLKEGFEIPEFDNFQYVKEKVIKKYVEGDTINFENDDEDAQDAEYIEDLQQIFALLEDGNSADEVRSMLKDAYIILTDNGDELQYTTPQNAYPPISDEGIDLITYFAEISDEDNLVAIDFYKEHGITVEQLKRLGIYSSIISEGEKDHIGSPGDPEWHAIGDYCPKLSVYRWGNNLDYIEEHPNEKLAKEKSSQMLNWMLRNYRKLNGQIKRNKTNTRIESETCNLLNYWFYNTAWLFNNLDEPCKIGDISKFELNTDIYGEIAYSKEAYEALGFASKEQDETADAFAAVDAMDNKQQEILLKQLARKYGYTLERSDFVDSDDWSSDNLFDANSIVSTDFPFKKVKNFDRLRAHVREQFYCADPVKYQQVLRQIRTSKDSKMVREYVSGMYTNEDGVRICQMCRKQAPTMEHAEIANFGIEMEQLNLCLCPNCARKYKNYRNQAGFKDSISEALADIWVDEDDDYDETYEVELSSDDSIFFNQIHISEIQEILSLLDNYGVPEDKNDEVEELTEGPLGPVGMGRLHDTDEDIDIEVATAGHYVSYKKKFDNDEIYDTTLQPDKFPLHRALEGHKVGDIIDFQLKEYEIIGL